MSEPISCCVYTTNGRNFLINDQEVVSLIWSKIIDGINIDAPGIITGDYITTEALVAIEGDSSRHEGTFTINFDHIVFISWFHHER